MSKKQSTHTVVTTVKNSPSSTKSENSKQQKKKAKNKQSKTIITKSVQAPIASASRLRSQKALTSTIANGVRVQHTELIGPVMKPTNGGELPLGSAMLQIYRLRCNPGSESTFAWLSSLAQNYEYYKFRKLQFYYETRSATTTSGSIIISPDYDAADGQQALDERKMFNNKGTVDDALWKHLTCNLDPQSMNRLYKSHANMNDGRFATTTQDQKTIDCAQLFVALDVDQTGAQKFGKLFVRYDVELTEPQEPSLPPNLGGIGIVSLPGAPSLSSLPFTVPFASNIKIDNTLMKANYDIPELVYPSAVIGRFAKDYAGSLITRFNGTGYAAGATYYVGDNSTSAAGGAGDVIVPTSPQLGIVATATDFLHVANLKALAGQYLKVRYPGFTALTSLSMELAGLTSGSQI